MRTPSGILSIAFYDYGVFIKSIGEGERSFGFLPGVEVVGLFAAEPVGEGSPYIYMSVLDQLLELASGAKAEAY